MLTVELCLLEIEEKIYLKAPLPLQKCDKKACSVTVNVLLGSVDLTETLFIFLNLYKLIDVIYLSLSSPRTRPSVQRVNCLGWMRNR